MEIHIDDDSLKRRIARYGPIKLFGDYKERQELSEDELIKRFNLVWEKHLSAAINQAEPGPAVVLFACRAFSTYRTMFLLLSVPQ